MPSFLKCKMCGGDLRAISGLNIAECEYCGTRQSVPRTPDERKTSYFNRANEARRANEFDKAIGIYESIVAEYPDEAEAYWGLCLCKFGIEYVDDSKTERKIPTCHRTVINSIFDDKDFMSAISYADNDQKQLYQYEASEIDQIQKSIIKTVNVEKPYDVFICYKESDERTGQRTKESVIGQSLFEELHSRGIKTFFARVSLEDVLGQEYEPHIFAALNSARVMLALGSSPDNFYAPWVRNEWSRYLEFLNQERGRTLIPCFIDMNAYDIPAEFVNLQAQDLGKVGSIQDIIRGIEKILGRGAGSARNSVATSTSETKSEALFERGKIAVRNKEWSKAQGFFDEVLNINPKEADAYTYLLLIEKKCRSLEELSKSASPIKDCNNYKNALEYADEDLENALEKLSAIIDNRYNSKKKTKIKRISLVVLAALIITLAGWGGYVLYVNNVVIPGNKYESAMQLMMEGKYDEAVVIFDSLGDYKDCKEKIEECKKAKEAIIQKDLNDKYESIISLIDEDNYETAINKMDDINSEEYKSRIVDYMVERLLKGYESISIANSLPLSKLHDDCLTVMQIADEEQKRNLSQTNDKKCIYIGLDGKVILDEVPIIDKSEPYMDMIIDKEKYKDDLKYYDKIRGLYKRVLSKASEHNNAQKNAWNGIRMYLTYDYNEKVFKICFYPYETYTNNKKMTGTLPLNNIKAHQEYYIISCSTESMEIGENVKIPTIIVKNNLVTEKIDNPVEKEPIRAFDE